MFYHTGLVYEIIETGAAFIITDVSVNVSEDGELVPVYDRRNLASNDYDFGLDVADLHAAIREEQIRLSPVEATDKE